MSDRTISLNEERIDAEATGNEHSRRNDIIAVMCMVLILVGLLWLQHFGYLEMLQQWLVP